MSLELNIEKQRKIWAAIAKENNWYKEPFFVQIFVDNNNKITDSVSFIGLERDLIVKSENKNKE